MNLDPWPINLSELEMKLNKFSRNWIYTSQAALVMSVLILSASSVTAQTESVAATNKARSIAAIKAAARSPAELQPNALGDFSKDNVYTAVTPCRIVDTRLAGGQFGPNVTRTYDVDGTDFTAQGGSSISCGIPNGVAASVAMTITVTGPIGAGYLTAWGLGVQPLSSVLNYGAGEVIANTSIVPVVPGAGADFSIYSFAGNPHVVVDVVGYFAAPSGNGAMTLSQLSGNWSATLSGFTGCGNSALQFVGSMGSTGLGTGTLTAHGSCGDSVVNNVSFNILTLNGNGTGTANLSCGAGCGWNLRIQVSPDRRVMNLVDVDPANPGNYLAGVAIRY
jgi:hypothetical protein